MGVTISQPSRSQISINAAIADPVPRNASNASLPRGGSGNPRANRSIGVGTGENVFVSCFIIAITTRMGGVLSGISG